MATLNGRRLDADEYAWDGRVLWLNIAFSNPVQVRLKFES